MIIRIILLLGLMSLLLACNANDKNYYINHPNALQKALKDCSKATKSCERLGAIAHHINKLGYDLQNNPQRFRLQIIKLQNQLSIQKNPQKIHELNERLAVVKWLESPRH